ncbi:MAG: hypothetical protein RBR42_13350, partial [Desulfomicrobium sp.]|nr:hypothetical protein [Desulfomicrobium sp.]
MQTTNAFINALPSTPTITGANNLCGLNNVVDYSIGSYNLSGKTAAWSIAGGNAYIVTGQNSTTITVNWGNASPTGSVNVTITETSTGCFVTTTNYIVNIWAEPTVYNTVADPANGLYCDGDPGVKIGLDNQEWNAATPVTYVLKQDGLPVAWHTPTSGDAGSSFWFNISGNQYFTGDSTVEFTVEAQTTYCNQFQNNSIYPEQYANAVADAGSGGDVCSDDLTSDLFTFTAAAAFTSGSGTSTPTGLWTYSGPGNATFDDDTDPATSVEVDAFGAYTFTWTVTNGPCVDSDAVTVNFYEKPALLFAVNNTDVLTTGSTWEYCYDENIEVSLNSIVAGTAPFTLKWDVFVDGSLTASPTYSNTTGYSVTNIGDVVWGPGILPAGSYDFELTSLVDTNGCSPTDVSLYNSTIVIHPEPTLTISVVDGSLNPYIPPYAFCYDGAFGISIAGNVGTGPWDFDYKITGPNGYLLNGNLKGTSGVVAVDLTDGYDPGTYTFEITSLSDAHCTATAATIAAYKFDVEVYAEPTIDLTIGGTSIIGEDLEYCYDADIDFTIAGVNGIPTWTFDWQVEYAGGGGIVPGMQFTGDYVDNTPENLSFPANTLGAGEYVVKITSLEDGNGCEASTGTIEGYWLNLTINPKPNPFFTIDGDVLGINATVEYCEEGLSEINIAIKETEASITDPGTAPYTIEFDIKENDVSGNILGSYSLTNVNYDVTTNLLLLTSPTAWFSGPGTYYIDVTLVRDANGCEIRDIDYPYYEFTLKIWEQPVVDAGADYTVCNASSYQIADASVSTYQLYQWSQVSGPGTASIPNDLNPTVTVDVAGTYVLKLVAYNGECEVSDEITLTFLKGTIADAYNFSAMPDIDAVSGAPVVMLMQYNLPVADNGADAGIIMDGIISLTSGTWPADAKVVEIERRQAITSTWFPVVATAGDLGGKDFVFLSDLIGISNPLKNNINPFYPWVITIEGIDGGTYQTEVQLVTYITKPTDLDADCYAVLDSEDFTLTFDDATVKAPVDCVVSCYTDDKLHTLEFPISIEYPTISNVDVDDEITLDARLTITDGNALNNVSVYWGYDAPAANLSTYTFTGKTTVLLSDIIGGSPTPLSNHSGTDVWNIKIVGLNPGYYEVKVDALALVENYIGTTIKNNTGVGLPQVVPADFQVDDYTYADDEFCLNVVGSLNVSINGIDNIETVTGAPVVVEFAVNYGDISGENIDASVLADALISFSPSLSATAEIVELKFGAATIATNYSLANANEVLLSDVVGIANPLNGHTDNSTDSWTAVFAGIDIADTYTITVQGIAYVGTYNPPANCYSETATDEFTITWADLEVSANTPPTVCEGTDVTGSQFSITYPAISNNPNTILTDASMEIDQDIPAGTILKWKFNAGAQHSYTFAALPANTPIKLSEIVGHTAPLQGHSGTITWDFEFSLLPAGVYVVTVTPLATLNSVDYTLITNPATLTQTITIYHVPDATIAGDAEVFSGSTHTYSVAVPVDGTPVYTWSSDQNPADVIITPTNQTASIEFVWPFTGTVVLTATVDNGICDDEQTFEVEVKPNILAGQLKYYNAGETPMPSPFMIDVFGNQVPGYFNVELYSVQNPLTLIEEVMVEEIYGEENALLDDDVYEAAFMFDYNLDPTEEYFVVVYDEEGFVSEAYWTMNNWGGVTAVDALFVQHMAAGNQINAFPNMSHIGDAPTYGFFANGVGDVNSSGTFTALDALLTSRRAVGLIPFFTNNTPNFRVAGKFVSEAQFNTPAVFGTTLPDIDFQRDPLASSPYESEYAGSIGVLGAGVHFLN